MIITTIICTLSIILFVGYSVITGNSLRKRRLVLTDENAEKIDSDLEQELNEYHTNLVKLGVMSIAISICTLLATIIV